MDEIPTEISIFKDAIMDDNVLIQVDAIKRLPALAATMDAERTREELIPCLANCVDALTDEPSFNLAEQLERLVPFVGGKDHVGILLDILVKLACEDELIVRERAVESMKNICGSLDKEQCEKSFFPVIEGMITSDWFTTKCSAGCLIAMAYEKMSPEKQAELRNFFRNLIQDESPMVRRSSGTSLIDFISVLDEEVIKSEFVPVFDNLAQDDQDSVRTIAVDVGIAISKKLKDFEVYEYLLPTFKQLSEDESWRVRQRIAFAIHEINNSEKNREEITKIYSKCVSDEESEVRVYAGKNLYKFTFNVLETFKKEDDWQNKFEKYFEENIAREIHLMLRDPNDDVRLALSTNILSLSAILQDDCFNTNILPLVIDALENEEFMPFKENMLKNLNSLPTNVDITKSLKSIRSVIQNLIENSQMHWRTRRNLLVAFMHISKTATSEFFDHNLKFFYQYLLNDPIYSIRRTAPLILPLLVKQFGMTWAKESLFPIFEPFSSDPRYLFRFTALFAIEELLEPTLDCDRESDGKDGKYLTDFKEIIQQSDKSIETLAKIVKLNDKLCAKLASYDFTECSNPQDNLKFYAEDTLENLRKEQKFVIFSVSRDELTDCYLEGVLRMLDQNFMHVIKELLEDSTQNVQDRTKQTVTLVKRFCGRVKQEADEDWVQEAFKRLSEDDLKKIEEEVNAEPSEENVSECETIDCEMVEAISDEQNENNDEQNENDGQNNNSVSDECDDVPKEDKK
ncbi:Serine/threonine-protein phosphatase PP2A 65 kDa regulatory subunit-like Protein [Tribolium castaneum]|uniref:Serine/threonine-protein phosphatase PP2A 65 kDa regulatory subunit-like Protein n=1 Tax=Tribolium castaneum TaxID=7070 RepID=D6X2J8_TRICA|nr:PREDICTED: serine/threonine-protein phosphatase 2A 65 kDa regulatory subunit A alpha isoform isoform X1 [Tribolium castaneum]EFA09434.1 Serine/threonine-protein phosphatase PP2A 65 kDa regulatory subunit-like Protein [Tribolium castaneum]|eukprot:XP_968175.2 PREDICTED: serine/threonine-protein phosphatase 2A 65 kDa regulatory subunit A alpha isoform isoform X1 [Tribolium castaneum]